MSDTTLPPEELGEPSADPEQHATSAETVSNREEELHVALEELVRRNTLTLRRVLTIVGIALLGVLLLCFIFPPLVLVLAGYGNNA
jgi:hypothetical protein